MINIFKSLFKFFNFKEKTNLLTIAELNSINLLKRKIEKEKRARAYISEINQKYSKIRKRENSTSRKVF